ncbi:hypothetical protein CLV58_109185 [Spirosoma oryzae]|uniref:Uncharacterized protein n=1 Tax=Spirosoma oryzae TaxID=1469603 RepID=A0A2T0SYG6_9BACT|nr:hypothetical protein [Spirosoma oryzae]PRY38458.1 hypothetical protein CLV58_109185 [Spirosoma oryzae]
MAVSFISRTLSSPDYIAPLDQNLVFQSLITRQQAYDKGVQQVDSLLENLSSQPIYNQGHKAYYEQKVGQLTDQLNRLGGADFSDRTTLQQIGQLSGLVSRDGRILSAIEDGKRIQQARQQIDTWKADPKKYPGQYAPQNEWLLGQQIQAYSTDSSEGARFQGGATPYVNHRKIIGDRVLQIQKQIAQTGGYDTLVGGKQQFIQTTKALTPLQIQQIVQGELAGDPALMNQLQIDAQYEARNLPTDTPSYQRARLAQLTSARDRLAKQADDYNSEGLLALTTGSPAQQEAARTEHQQQLKQISRQMRAYEEQIRAVGSQSRDEAVLGMHLDSYVTGLQAEYGFESRKLQANPIYGVELAHQDRQAALEQAGSQFRIREQNENDRFLYGWKKQDEHLDKQQAFQREQKLLDLEAKTGLQANGDGSYSTPDTAFKAVDLGASQVTTTSLEAMQAQSQSDARAQNGRILDLVVSYVGNGDLQKMAGLRAQLTVSTDSDGNINGIKYPKSVAPNVAVAARQIVDDYHQYLQGNGHNPDLIRQLKPEQRAMLQQIEVGAAQNRIAQQQYKDIEQQAIRESGMTQAELNRMNQLRLEKARNPQLFSTATPVPGGGGLAITSSAKAQELASLEARFKPAQQTVIEQLGKSGIYNRGFLVTGDAAKKDSDLYRIVKHRIDQQAVDPAGATNSQLRAIQSQLENGEITQMVVLKDSQQIEVSGFTKNGEEKVPFKARVDFMGSADWNAVLSDKLRTEQGGGQKALLSELDKKGALLAGKRAVAFAPVQSQLAFSVSPVKTSSGYGLGLLYQGKQIPIPPYFKNGVPFIPTVFQQKPIQFVSGGLDNWSSTNIERQLKARYGATDPAYKPTIHDFYRFITDPELFP